MKKNRCLITWMVWLSAGLLLIVPGMAFSQSAVPHWSNEAIRAFETLPIQEGGRVKPLSAYAGFKLLKLNGKRSCKDADGKTLAPTEWMMNCLFYPDKAIKYKMFRIDNSAVLVALELPFEKKRDSYAYKTLAPANTKLLELARQSAAIPEPQRTTVQSQLLNLYQNMQEYQELIGFFDFARQTYLASAYPEISTLFPGKSAVTTAELLPIISKMNKQSSLLLSVSQTLESAWNLHMIPPVKEESQQPWYSPGELFEKAFRGAIPEQTAAMVSQLQNLAVKSGDAAAFTTALNAFHQSVTDLAKSRNEYGRINLEVFLYHADPFYNALVLYIIGFMLVAFLWFKPENRLLRWSSFCAVLIPTLLLAGGITLRCIIRERPPVTTLYETILFSTFVAVFLSLAMEFVNRKGIALTLAASLGVLGLFLANKYEAMEGTDTMPSMIAVLDTNFWLATHVTTITIGYGAGFLASAFAHIYVIGHLFRRNVGGTFYKDITRMTYGVLSFGLLFSMVGTVLGGIWANESWGRFWGWDPKENGALMIVLWQLILLHARMGGYIRETGLNLGAIIGGIVVAFSWFGVNLLGVGLHSYGFTSGAYKALMFFYIVEGIVFLTGCIVCMPVMGTPQNSTGKRK